MSDLIPGILDLLVCPNCHGQLAWDYEASELVCTNTDCALAYPVRGGIAIPVIDEARPTQDQ